EPGNSYLGRSSYATALEPFLERYPRDRILILRQEDLRDRRRATLGAVFRFLGVDDSFWSERMERLRNTRGASRRSRVARRVGSSPPGRQLYKLGPEWKWWIERTLSTGARVDRPGIDPDLRGRLLAQLEPDIAGLARLTACAR